MFSQKKKRGKKVIIALSSILFVLLAAFFFIPDKMTDTQVNANKQAEQSKDMEKYPNSTGEKDTDVNVDTDIDVDNAENNDEDEKKESYYLVKYDNNSIKVFFHENTGNIVKLDDTSIVYDTLAESDQKNFEKGIHIKTREELYKLLQDFES
ncbi:MAG: hypothetical protein RSE31_00090 [Anaerovoracaceae bacterium]